MKKIFLLTLLTIFALSIPTQASLLNPPQRVCAVIVGGPDVKTPDFFKYMDEAFNGTDNSARKNVDSGTKIQSQYQSYWLNKGFLEEQKLTKQDLHDFVKFSGYDKVIFLVASQPVVEKNKQGGGSWGTWAVREHTRASIGVKVFFVDSENVIKAIDVTKQDDSNTSELRAKRGAWTKCLEEITTALGNVNECSHKVLKSIE